MKEIKENTYKGTRILLGNRKRIILNKMLYYLRDLGFEEISIPIIQPREIFAGKVGEENTHMMYTLTDQGQRDLCLAPEYTAVIQQLSSSYFKQARNLKLFYVQECFRGEKPQAGRYRQFTQVGVEILNPTEDFLPMLIKMAKSMLACVAYDANPYWYREVFEKNITVNTDVTRGLDYYIGGKGFEISYEELGAQKQVCGGGLYMGGIGFALGLDRLLEIEVPK